LDLQDRLAALEAELMTARRMIAHGEYWDAIRILEPAVEAAQGTRLVHRVQVLLGLAVSKNPKWLKRAEEILQRVAHEDPHNVEAHFVLGAVYRNAGLKKRALAELHRVLELDPFHAKAASALAAVRRMPDPSGRSS